MSEVPCLLYRRVCSLETVERGHFSRDFQAFAVDMAANQRVNEKSSDAEYELCALTLPVASMSVACPLAASMHTWRKLLTDIYSSVY